MRNSETKTKTPIIQSSAIRGAIYLGPYAATGPNERYVLDINGYDLDVGPEGEVVIYAANKRTPKGLDGI